MTPDFTKRSFPILAIAKHHGIPLEIAYPYADGVKAAIKQPIRPADYEMPEMHAKAIIDLGDFTLAQPLLAGPSIPLFHKDVMDVMIHWHG